MKKISILFVSLLLAIGVFAQSPSNNTVIVVYNGATATVSVADNISQYLTVTQSGAHVRIVQSDSVATEITYNLSGTSSDGEFYMSGSYKASLELNGLTLTNTSPMFSGAAIHIQNGKRINVRVVAGTTNTLVDAANGTQKGCLYVKGHAEFKQQGTLNVVGNVKHAIKADEYISLKNATINVTSAMGDGISCNEYFLMESGNINISGTVGDGIQCDLDGTVSTGEISDHEDEDSGNMYLKGGNITINCTGTAAKGLKSAGDVKISGGTITVTTSGGGTWDADDLETKAACALSSDGNITISGGTLNLNSTGSGGKGIKCDGFLTITDGNITVLTSGNLYFNNGTTENTNYTGNTEMVNSSYYSSPKGIKAGLRTEDDNGYVYSGGIVINGGNIEVSTSGNNGEGVESKNNFEINGGVLFINAHDDAINAGQNLTVNGGYIYARSANNDGMDANGNFYINDGLVFAIGSHAPELALDANTEDQKKLYINGGTIIAVGGIERGSVITQATYQTSSIVSDAWYSMTYGDHVVAFYTPSISGGGPGGPGGSGGNSSKIVVSAPAVPTLMSDVTVVGGTGIFEDNCYLDAVVNGGADVTLTYIGGTVGIDEHSADEINIRVESGRIMVVDCDNCHVQVFDIDGRQVRNNNLSTGVYLVKVDNYPVRKVVVVR